MSTQIARASQINNAIADACGWEMVRNCDDLNVMHDAEGILMGLGDAWADYCDILLDIIVRDSGYQAAELFCHASARQRARAFIRAWEKHKAFNP